MRDRSAPAEPLLHSFRRGNNRPVITTVRATTGASLFEAYGFSGAEKQKPGKAGLFRFAASGWRRDAQCNVFL